MKNLILLTLLSLMLTVSTSVLAQTSTTLSTIQTDLPSGPITGTTLQSQIPNEVLAVEKVSFFARIKDWAVDGGINIIIGMVLGLFAKNGVTKAIKAFSGKAAVILKETGETFIGGSNFFDVVNKAIKDDGTVEQNNIKDVIAAGKEVIAEANDVVISIKPKVKPII